MKRIITLSLGVCFLATSFARTNVVLPTTKAPVVNANTVMIPIGKNGQKVSLMDLSQMKVKEFEALSGKKLKLGQKIEFSLGQKQLRNSINADGTINAKKIAKVVAKAKAKEMNDQSRRYLKLWLILLGVSIVLDIIAVAAVSPIIWVFGALAGLGALIFFILWLIALAG